MADLPVWIFVFLFHGLPMASGPHELEQCLMLAAERPGSHCWNPRTQERKRG